MEILKAMIQKKITNLQDYIDRTTSSTNFCLILKHNAHSLYVASFKKIIWEDILQAEDKSEMKSVAESYLRQVNRIGSDGRLMDCTNSIIYNVSTLWDRETLMSMKQELESVCKILSTFC